jgi:hypothetical protein
MRWSLVPAALVLCLTTPVLPADADEVRPDGTPAPYVQVGGVFPHMTVMAPGVGSDSETGIGALVAWADRLWAVGYVAHVKGEGIGLYEIGAPTRSTPAGASGRSRP